MPVKPPPPTSPGNHNPPQQQQQQPGTRSSGPLKQHAPVTSTSPGRTGGGPLQQNNTLINNSQQQQHNSSTNQNSTNQPQHPQISSANNNQLHPSRTGNGNTPPTSRPSLGSTGTGGKGGNISPNRTPQSPVVSPKVERYHSMTPAGDGMQPPGKTSPSNETARLGAASAKQHSKPNTNNSGTYQTKSASGNSNNLSTGSPTTKRPRKGSGGVHSKQQSQQASHHGTSPTDNVSRYYSSL